MLTKWQLFCTLQLCFLELTDDKGTTHVTEEVGGKEFSTVHDKHQKAVFDVNTQEIGIYNV